MPDLVLDTDAASVLQKHRAPAWVERGIVGNVTWLTFVTVGELATWAESRNWGATNRARLDEWIARQPVIPYDVEIAKTWGWLAARARRRGRPRPQNDMWVAASCIRHRIPLLTLNEIDFADFAEHDGLVLLKP